MNRLVPLIFVLMIPTSTVSQLSQREAGLEKSVEHRVEVAENKTIFAVFCLLNLGGYDAENNPDGMHPVRVRVREQLANKVRPELAKRIRDFYRRHTSAEPYHYSVVAMSTGGPPDLDGFTQSPGYLVTSTLVEIPFLKVVKPLPIKPNVNFAVTPLVHVILTEEPVKWVRLGEMDFVLASIRALP
jgi:hypothetical protein